MATPHSCLSCSICVGWGGNGFGAAKIILFFRCATTALQEFSPHPGLSLFAHRIPPVGPPQIAHFSRISSPLPPLLQLSLAFLLPLRYEEANIGNFPLKVPRFSSKVPHFCAFTPAFCRAPRTAHPPCAIRCIFPPHLRSATGVKRTSSIYSCTTSSDAGVPFPFRCRKVPSFLTTCAPRLVFSPPSLSKFSFNSSNPSSHVRLLQSPHPQISSLPGHQPDFSPTYRRHICEI